MRSLILRKKWLSQRSFRFRAAGTRTQAGLLVRGLKSSQCQERAFSHSDTLQSHKLCGMCQKEAAVVCGNATCSNSVVRAAQSSRSSGAATVRRQTWAMESWISITGTGVEDSVGGRSAWCLGPGSRYQVSGKSSPFRHLPGLDRMHTLNVLD